VDGCPTAIRSCAANGVRKTVDIMEHYGLN
jgi:hypothetical protein